MLNPNIHGSATLWYKRPLNKVAAKSSAVQAPGGAIACINSRQVFPVFNTISGGDAAAVFNRRKAVFAPFVAPPISVPISRRGLRRPGRIVLPCGQRPGASLVKPIAGHNTNQTDFRAAAPRQSDDIIDMGP
jgi:hypothetical protein